MITAIIQARLGSTRLPGKVMLPLGGKTVLAFGIDRIRQAKKIDEIIVATTDNDDGNVIVEECKKIGVQYFQGNEEDVLDRYYQAAKKFNAENICRITSDCPLIDPNIIDLVANKFLTGEYDYISTGRITSTFPDGMDTEVFTFEALEKAWKEAKLSSEREHVTPYIWKNPKLFKVFTEENQKDLSVYRLTLDEPADYELLKNIVKNCQDLFMVGIVDYLNHNINTKNINANINRDEGYFESLKADK